MFEFFKDIKTRVVKWCLNEQTISVGELHERSSPKQCAIYNEGELKFIEQTTPIDTFVKTPTGFSRIKHSHKTVPYKKWCLTTTTHQLYCADEHIVINSNDEEVYVKDLSVGDLIKTDTGTEPIISVVETPDIETMYDLELWDTHTYYTNGILSHNSATSAAFLLWFAAFHPEKTILIASNKNDNAMEMIYRIRFMYERLPHWLKPGLTDDGWNKHSVGFDNGSRIHSTATSENSGRGLAISLLYLDEFAFVRDTVQQEFWTSMAPTLATGGACIITSTPNGDSNRFAQLWRGALVDANGFVAIEVKWDEPPGRDKKFKELETAKIGELRWKQEYECLSGTSMIEIQDEHGIIRLLSIEEAYCKLLNNEPLVETD